MIDLINDTSGAPGSEVKACKLPGILLAFSTASLNPWWSAANQSDLDTEICTVRSQTGEFFQILAIKSDTSEATDNYSPEDYLGSLCYKLMSIPDFVKEARLLLPDILAVVGLFTEAWHLLAAAINPAWIPELIEHTADERLAKALGKLRFVLQYYDPAEYRSVIDGFDGIMFSGWVFSEKKSAPGEIDIYQDRLLLRHGYLPNSPRPDLVAAGLGSCSFLLPAERQSLDSDPCFSLISCETGKTIAFRFFDSFGFPTDYQINIDACPPNDPPFEITGWIINAGFPNQVFETEAFIDGAFYGKLSNNLRRNDLPAGSGRSGGFRLAFPLIWLSPGPHDLQFRYPDGNASERFIFNKSAFAPRIGRIWQLSSNKTVLIIPVTDKALLVEQFLEKALSFSAAAARILFVTNDEGIAASLAPIAKAAEAEMLIFREKEVRALNEAILSAGNRNIAILCPSLLPSPRWLNIMEARALSHGNNAIVVPLIMGVDGAGGIEDTYGAVASAIAFRRAGAYAGLPPDVAKGCVYIPSPVREKLGYLDASIPDINSAMTEYVWRARRQGIECILDDSLLMYSSEIYSGSDFFNYELRYPEFKNIDERFPERNKLVRWKTRKSEQDSQSLALPRILFAVSSTIGGTPQTNKDLMDSLTGSVSCFLLHCDGRITRIYRYDNGEQNLLAEHVLSEPIEPYSHCNEEYDAVAANWLLEFDIDIVHIRHLIWHSLRLPEIARGLGCAVIYSFHDFYSASPNLNLIDDSGQYLGNDYHHAGSPYRQNIWNCVARWHTFQPAGHEGYILSWRERFAKSLSHCHAFVTTSTNAATTISHLLPDLNHSKMNIIPHGRNFKEFNSAVSRWRIGEKIRIAIPGNINHVKGLGVITSLLAYDRLHENILEFHIFGLCDSRGNSGFITHGPYNRDELGKHIADVKPHAGGVLSIWDETWCHTLTELWAQGLPVFVFHKGTVSDRVRRNAAGWILPDGDIPEIYQAILDKIRRSGEHDRVCNSIRDWQTGIGSFNSAALMGLRYHDLYRATLAGGKEEMPLVGICVDYGNAACWVRLIEKCRPGMRRKLNYLQVTPQQLLAGLEMKQLAGFILQRNIVPQHLIGPVLSTAAKNHIPYVYDIDDDLLNVPPDKDPDGRYCAYRPYIAQIIGQAAAVVASTKELNSGLSTTPAPVYTMGHVLASVWQKEPAMRQYDKKIRALYYGTPSHRTDLMMVLPWLAEISDRNDNFRVLIIGILKQDDPLAKDYKFLEIGQVPDENRIYPRFTRYMQQLVRDVDFAIAPLAESKFNALKTPLKILEAGALGLPVIASNVLPFNHLSGIPALKLVKNQREEWSNAIACHVEAGLENRKSGEKLRKYILDRFLWTEKHADMWDNLILATINGQEK